MDQSAKAKQHLADAIESTTAVMLGLESAPDHFQPMAPHHDEDGSIWFFTRKSSDLVGHVGQGARAHMIVVGDGQKFYACCAGTLTQNYDEAKRDKFWSATVDAWFAEGKSDPDLTLLHFVPHDAMIWVNEKSGVAFAWEIVKANLMNQEAEAGWKAHVYF
jgi:general stress protein 26